MASNLSWFLLRIHICALFPTVSINMALSSFSRNLSRYIHTHLVTFPISFSTWNMVSRVYHLRHFFHQCIVFMWFSRALYPWKQIGMFDFYKIFIPTLPLATKILKLQWGGEQRFNPFHIGISKMRHDERIQNLVSEFKADYIWPHLLIKKNVKSWENTLFWQFSTVFGQKWGQILFDLISETRFTILSERRTFLAPK